ncbi:MAG: RlmE family RNA methyltransferase [Candidatus Thalassarchaeaceae archaeon]|jgi:23S rRNA (uridine2552-2'-O)-methyltransferase|nr:RlmE family RNA methyltransferase [Candidatus Thalassarchaeaceae archaeon]
MSKRWFQAHQRDTWRRQARSKGYRARSAFKLKQIQEKFTLIREGDLILDVGSHPGGWTQVSVEETGPNGLVIGIDLLASAPVEGAQMVIGDVTETTSQELILDLLQAGTKVDGTSLPPVGADETRLFNTIVSDISPRLTGQYDRDQAISLELVAMVFDFTMPLLVPGGAFVTKIFQGTGIEGVVNAAKQRFSRVQRFSPEASRNSSSEVFLVCKNKLPRPKKGSRGTSVAQELNTHLESEGIIQHKDSVPIDSVKSGFRRIPKKE